MTAEPADLDRRPVRETAGALNAVLGRLLDVDPVRTAALSVTMASASPGTQLDALLVTADLIHDWLRKPTTATPPTSEAPVEQYRKGWYYSREHHRLGVDRVFDRFDVPPDDGLRLSVLDAFEPRDDDEVWARAESAPAETTTAGDSLESIRARLETAIRELRGPDAWLESDQIDAVLAAIRAELDAPAPDPDGGTT